jgi:transposase
MLKAEIRRELDRIALVTTQLAAVERARDALIRTDAEERNSPAALLLKLKGLGLSSPRSSGWNRCFAASATDARWRLTADWRPVPGRAAASNGIRASRSRANRRLRKTMIELAWLWLRHQPDSALSRWFQARVGAAKGRIRRIAIVALARKLLVALWRYVTQGVVPEGAVFKAA